MKLLRCNPTGFFSYGLSDWVDLQNQGVVHLRGDIGSGKSSIFNSICEVMFGTSPQRDSTREVVEGDVVNRTMRKALGAVEAKVRDTRYRVIYCRDWTGDHYLTEPSEQIELAGGYSGTTVYFERWDQHTWVQRDTDGSDLRFPKMSDTWAKVSSVLGIDYSQFLNTCYCAQDRALSFLKGKNADREEIITQIKRLGVYDQWEQKAKLRHKDAASEVLKLETVVQTLTGQAAAIQVPDAAQFVTRLKTAETTLAGLEQSIQTTTQNIATAQMSAQVERTEALRLRAKLDETIKKIYAVTASAQQKQGQVKAETQAAAVACSKVSNETGRAELLAATGQINSAKAVFDNETKRLNAMLPGAGKCSSCGSKIDANTLATHKAEQMGVVEQAKVAWKKAEEQYRMVDQQRAKTVEEEQRKINDARDARIKEIEAQVATELAEALQLEAVKVGLQAQVAQAEAKSQANTAELDATLKKLNESKLQWTTELANVKNALQAIEQRQADRSRIEAQVAETQKVLVAQKDEASEWSWLAKNYPKIKQLKFASVLNDLNERLAFYLNILTDGKTSVILEPYKLKKSAEKKKPEKISPDDYIYEFQMSVTEPGKPDVPIQLYSGGQRAQITLALIASFWELASTQGGVSNILLLDEVIHYMNEGAIERTVRLMDALRQKVETLIIVGHDPTFPALLNPDRTWTAVLNNGMTRLQV